MQRLLCGVVLLTALLKATQVDSKNISTFLGERYYSYRCDEATAEFASQFLDDLNTELRAHSHALAEATWGFQTNRSILHRQKLTQSKERFHHWYVAEREKASALLSCPLPRPLQRQLEIFTLLALVPKDKELAKIKSELQTSMENRYSLEAKRVQTREANNAKTDVLPEHDPLSVMSTSHDPELLKRAWLKWRKAVGPPIKPLYRQYVEVLNLSAVENGFPDYSAYWKQKLFYETPDVDAMLDSLWGQVRPLYLQLHAYVRRKLVQVYGGREFIGSGGSIPAHLLGDMWGQHWSHINAIVTPFPEADDTAAIESRLRRSFTPKDLFRLAEDFYTSLGLPEMTRQFWEKSQLVGDRGSSGACQASAFDLYSPDDYRIKMCAKTGLNDLKTVHHEMGHIEYFMAYRNQPTIYRAPPTSAFHESVGDTVQLSVLSDKRLRALGLVGSPGSKPSCPSCQKQQWRHRHNIHGSMKRTISKLMRVALDKLAFLPFGLLVDKWRWAVFQGNITPENYNRKWWEFRLQYQGIRSPVPRSERDFDPGAKYHIPAHMPFASYFVAYIQEFQMYRALCKESGHRGRLHECDFYGSHKAGEKLSKMLRAGCSQPWQTLLRDLTGSSRVTADAILEYFRPLRLWLEENNAAHGQTIGWDRATVNWEDE